jgi:hypothetical protein
MNKDTDITSRRVPLPYFRIFFINSKFFLLLSIGLIVAG